MDLQVKTPHNYLPYLIKTDVNTPFHSIIDVLMNSKYLPVLTADAPLYIDTLQQFWLNAEISLTNKKPTAIISKIGNTSVAISPDTISSTFSLRDLQGNESFSKTDLHNEFIERGYEGQLTGATVFKPQFPPEMKFFFHTLLICLSAKTTSFNEIPLKVQYLGYAILTKTDYNLSQALFMDLVANVKAVKSGSNNAFLLYPRLLSFYLQKALPENVFQQGEVFKIKSLSNETFTRMLGSKGSEKAPKSKISKTQAKKVATSVAQTSVAEPTAPGDHGTTTSAVEPTPAIFPKKPIQSKKPTKHKPKRPTLEDEIPEHEPAVTQIQHTTSVDTSSHQMQISQPSQTTHTSSQKEYADSQGATHQEAFDSIELMFSSPSPRATSLFPPSSSPSIPIIHPVLFEAIEHTQSPPGSSLSPIIESIPPQVTGSETTQSAIPQTEEAIPFELPVTLSGGSSEAATTAVETIVSQLDSGYIAKTSLKATTVEATTVTSDTVGSPQYQEQGAFGSSHMDSTPVIEPNTTTTSGRNSDDPINLGDGLKYQELTERVTNIESSLSELKGMMQTLLANSQTHSSSKDTASELWTYVQPFLITQRRLADISHDSHMGLIRNMVDARYKDTQADIRAIKDHLLKTTGSTPTTFYVDDAKKGENDTDKLRKLQPDKRATSSKVQNSTEPGSDPSTTAKQSSASKEKEVDETQNLLAEKIAIEKQKRLDTMEAKASILIEERKAEQKMKENIGSSRKTRPAKRCYKLPDVSTPSSPPSKPSSPPTKVPSPPPSPKPSTPPSSPVIKYKRKRKTFQVQDDEISQPSTPSNPTIIPSKPSIPIIKPLAEMYPLELAVISKEIESFYSEDTSSLSFPSLPNFPKPKNLDEYLKLKGVQAERIAKEKCKGKDDRTAQSILSAELGKVRNIEDFAKELSMSMSEKPMDTELEKELRTDYLDHIMKNKPYKATRSQFAGWTTPALKNEIQRIQNMLNDPLHKPTPPDWKKGRLRNPKEALKLKRMREELVAADFGPMKSVARWSESRLLDSYKRLKELRAKDPSIPRKPDYSDDDQPPQQTQAHKSLLSTSHLTITALNQRKRQKEMSEEDQVKFAQDLWKEGLKNQLLYSNDPASDEFRQVISRILSPNSSKITFIPANPSDSKILKWKSNKDTYELTLLRSDGRVQKISMEDAHGLPAKDLQELLYLELERDFEDMVSFNFELQFKGQIRESLMRNKDQ